jgi:uncharacterized protein YjbJ (UPF0337 family)
MVNEQILRGNWNEIRGKLQERYGQLTNDDVREYEGNVDQLVGLIQQKTGESREAIVHYLDKLTESGASFLGTPPPRPVTPSAAEWFAGSKWCSSTRLPPWPSHLGPAWCWESWWGCSWEGRISAEPVPWRTELS